MKIRRKDAWLAAAGSAFLLGAILVFPQEKRAHAAKSSALVARDQAIDTGYPVADSPVENPRTDGDGIRASANATVDASAGMGSMGDSSGNPRAAFSADSSTISSSPSETRAALNAVAGTSVAAAHERAAAQPEPAQPHLPAALLSPPNIRAWNEDDLATVATLAKNFTDSVVGSSQSPADPQYYYRWIDEERLANERYRSYFGNAAFNALRNPDN